MSNLRNIVITVDVPEDEATSVEAAAAAAVAGLTDAGVLVTAAKFAGRSLLPNPVEELRAAIDALSELTRPGERPGVEELRAAVARADRCSTVIEALVADYDDDEDLADEDDETAAAAAAETAAATTVALPD